MEFISSLNFELIIKTVIILVILYIFVKMYTQENFGILTTEVGEFTYDGKKYYFTLDKQSEFDVNQGPNSPDWVEITNIVNAQSFNRLNAKEILIDNKKYTIVGLSNASLAYNKPKTRLGRERSIIDTTTNGIKTYSNGSYTNRRFIIRNF